MLTNNFKKLICVKMNNFAKIKDDYRIKDVTGSLFYIRAIPTFDCTSVAVNSNVGIKIGSGTTPATEEDYNLESLITGSFSYNVSFTDEGKIVQITNNSASNITINEVGFFINCGSSSTPTSTNTGKFYLIDRTVLNAPLTIEPGGIGKIKYNIDIQ